jgi:hypothetical protein
MDRWEQTPLDEARRVGAQPVVEYLEAQLPSKFFAIVTNHNHKYIC